MSERETETLDQDGTPRTLSGAIALGFIAGAPREIRESLRSHVRDFLAQRFSVAMLKSESKDEIDRIQELWTEIMREDL